MRTHMRLWLPLVLGLLLFVAACDATQEDLAEHDDDITSNADADDQSDVDADDGDSDDDADTADDFPNRTINYVVPAAAGGSSDAIARIVEEYGSEYIGGDLVVENRDGAAGTLAVAEVMGAEPDGHTLVQPPVGPFTTQDYFQDLQYSVDDFEPVINLTNESNVLAALTERGWETVDDMITEYEESGEMLQYGSSGAGTLLHLAQIDLYNHVGIEADHVPFDGAARSVPALLGGSVDVVVAHPPELIEHAEAGTVQMLGVFSEEPDPQIPDVPTIVEQVGYDTYWDVYKFVMAPAGTSQTIVDHLHDGFEEMLNDEDAANALESLGLAIRYMDGEELGQTLREDNENMGQVIQESGVLEDME